MVVMMIAGRRVGCSTIWLVSRIMVMVVMIKIIDRSNTWLWLRSRLCKEERQVMEGGKQVRWFLKNSNND